MGSILLGLGIVVFGGFAYLLRELPRCLREHRAEMWQAVTAQITNGDVRVVYGRFIEYAIGKVGYAYSIDGEYHSGYLTRQSWGEQRAWTFVDACRNLQVMVRYKPNKPDVSALARTDLAIAETGMPMGRSRRYSPWLATLGPVVTLVFGLKTACRSRPVTGLLPKISSSMPSQ
ncbi:MAG TPA: DUF3592 domain-containing protein [Terriglobales bacterium]|nr:DUF3592 domain-containing protein [Terriglobales bacterium]